MKWIVEIIIKSILSPIFKKLLDDNSINFKLNSEFKPNPNISKFFKKRIEIKYSGFKRETTLNNFILLVGKGAYFVGVLLPLLSFIIVYNELGEKPFGILWFSTLIIGYTFLARKFRPKEKYNYNF